MAREAETAEAQHVYKALRHHEHADVVYLGSPLDRKDGFVHLSPRSQLQRTVELYFAAEQKVLIVGFRVAELGPALKWEKSRDDLLFPHLYARLDLDRAVVRREVSRLPDGSWPRIEDLPA